MSDIAERELDSVGNLAAENARAGYLFRGGDSERLGPPGFAAGYCIKYR
jgi:hypothetical protein